MLPIPSAIAMLYAFKLLSVMALFSKGFKSVQVFLKFFFHAFTSHFSKIQLGSFHNMKLRTHFQVHRSLDLGFWRHQESHRVPALRRLQEDLARRTGQKGRHQRSPIGWPGNGKVTGLATNKFFLDLRCISSHKKHVSNKNLSQIWRRKWCDYLRKV